MKIKSAIFVKGITGENEILNDGKTQIAFIGRSNAGKSSLINSITGDGKLAKTSSNPGKTQELNIFLINKSVYFVDLPGYGFAKTGAEVWQRINKLVYWYLFESTHNPKVVLIIDAEVGPTKDDLGILKLMELRGKDIIIVANKIDKIKKSHCFNQIKKLQEQFTGHVVIPFSSKDKIGINELVETLII